MADIFVKTLPLKTKIGMKWSLETAITNLWIIYIPGFYI